MAEDQERRIAELERRVQILEERLKAKSSPQEKKVPIPKASENKQPQPHESLKPPQQEPKDGSMDSLEKRIGSVWLPRVFLFVLLLGVVWAFVALYEGGFLTETVLIVVGYAVSIGLLFLGRWQYNLSHYSLAQVLLAGAVGIATLTTFAGHALYGLIPLFIAFILNIAVAIGGVALTVRYQSQALGILAAITGFLNPILLDSTDPNISFFAIYEFVVYVLFFLVAIKFRFVGLFYVSVLALHAVYLPVAWQANTAETYFMYGLFSLQHLMLLAVLFLKEYQKYPIGMIFTQYVLLTGWMFFFFTKSEFLWSLIGWLLLHLMTSCYFYWRIQSRGRAGFILALVAYSIFLLSARYFDEWLTSTLVVTGIISMILGNVLRSDLQRVVGIISLFHGVFFLLFQMPFDIVSTEHMNWFIALVSFTILYVVGRMKTLSPKMHRLFQQYEVVYIFAVWLYMSLFIHGWTKDISEDVSLYSLSFAWIVYAAACIFIGFRSNRARFRTMGVGLLFVTLAKVFFVDISEVSIAIRAVLFIVLGGIGIGISRFFYSNK